MGLATFRRPTATCCTATFGIVKVSRPRPTMPVNTTILTPSKDDTNDENSEKI